MIIFDTISPLMVNPIVDVIMKTSQTQFQDLDSRVFLSLVLSGREVSVEGFPYSSGMGMGNGFGFGQLFFKLGGLGGGESSGMGKGVHNLPSHCRGDGFRKYTCECPGMGDTFGKGDGRGNGKFPLLQGLDPHRQDCLDPRLDSHRPSSTPRLIWSPFSDCYYHYDYYGK